MVKDEIDAGHTIEDIEQTIDNLGYGTEAYHEALAMYFIMLAKSQWRLADNARRTRNARTKK